MHLTLESHFFFTARIYKVDTLQVLLTVGHIKEKGHYTSTKNTMKKFSVIFVGLIMEYTYFNADVLFKYEKISVNIQSTNNQGSVWCQLEDGYYSTVYLLWCQA